jgi:hypothetical protein
MFAQGDMRLSKELTLSLKFNASEAEEMERGENEQKQ